MTESEKIEAYHHALQYWWKRALALEAEVEQLKETVEALHY